MRNVLLVVRHEVRAVLSQPSFWVMAFVFPVIILVLNVGVQVITTRSLRSRETIFAPAAPGAEIQPGGRIGYVDAAGLIAKLPEDRLGSGLERFPNEAAARAAVDAGQIERYAVIAPDYVQSGDVLVVERDYRPLDATAGQLLQYVIAYNLMGDAGKASALADPLREVTAESLAPRPSQERGGASASYVAMATLFIFFFLISTSSGLMLQSVSREKENRTAEVLLLSVPPRELMLGKVFGLSLVALLQMAIWVAVPLRFLGSPRGQEVSALGVSINVPPGFVLWALLYFLLGYLLYASLMAAIGALAPTSRAGSQVTVIILLPLMIPLLVNTAFVQAPNGLLVTALSLFPLTAPTAMITRLATTPVPAWQVVASAVGLGASAYLLVLLAARLFRAETLLSDTALSWGRIAAELRKR